MTGGALGSLVTGGALPSVEVTGGALRIVDVAGAVLPDTGGALVPVTGGALAGAWLEGAAVGFAGEKVSGEVESVPGERCEPAGAKVSGEEGSVP